MSDNQNPFDLQNSNLINTNSVISPSTSDDTRTQAQPSVPSGDTVISPGSMENTSVSENGQAAISDSNNYNTTQFNQEEVVTAPHAPQKYGGKKVIATIFGMLILIGGIAAGVILVQHQQQMEERAASGKECQQASDCSLLDEPGNSGSFSAPKSITKVNITAKDVFTFLPGTNEDGCYRVKIEGRDLTWQRYGDGPDCKDVSNVQVWFSQGDTTPTEKPESTPTTPPNITNFPSISAECSDVKAYNTGWVLLSQTQLNQLDPGTKVRFTVSGTASSGSFDKARLSVNATSLGETTLKKSGSDEFYIEYTIPTNITSFVVSAQIHHSELGWF